MPVSVWTSTLQRTIQTAEQLPFPKLRWKVRPAVFSSVSALCNSSLCWEPTALREVPSRHPAVCRMQPDACPPVEKLGAAMYVDQHTGVMLPSTSAKKGSGKLKAHQLYLRQVLDEIQAGVFDGMTYAQIEQTMPEEFAARKADKLGYRCVRLLCSHV